jgi:acyl transferase domain-containing protein/acyl carrier protein
MNADISPENLCVLYGSNGFLQRSHPWLFLEHKQQESTVRVTEQTNSSQLMRKALVELKEMRAKLQQIETAQREPIAIVGMGCRFPGGDGPAAFWDLLRTGGDAIREVPAERWSMDAFYDPDPETAGKIITRYGGFVERVDGFDAPFFGISPREAVGLDPQQRLLLEVSWEALENGAIAPDGLAKSRTGVFVGICGDDYARRLFNQPAEQIDAYVATGTAHSTATGRLSYLLGLQGPSLAVDTACSSSLVAVHLAVMSLRQGECDLALAGGSHLILSPEYSINFSRANMLAPDGRCKTFDSAANGYVRGEGCGVVVLKRLSDAQRDGDPIVALIRGSAVNQDGRTNGLTAPNGLAQQAVIRGALANAGVSAQAVGYVEAHGTGTPLGDPIEMNALAAVFQPTGETGDQPPLFVGAVKTNVGHLEASAGIVGLIKTALALQQGEIPPNLHFHTPNPHIAWDDLAVQIPTAPTPWPGGRPLAGVSAFGFSGTNAHLVLAPAPEREERAGEVESGLQWLALSARTPAALSALAQDYADFLTTNPGLPLADICYTAYQGRAHFEQRLAMVGASHGEMAAQLAAFAASGGDDLEAADVVTGSVPAAPRPVAFLFTGQGAQAVDMGRQLYASQPLFRDALNRCAEILRPFLDRPLLDVIFAGMGPDGVTDLLDQTGYTQPALFALEYALAQLWQSWGVEPALLLGHSVGEYVAACLAGVFSLEDGLKLIAARARLMQSLPAGGEMVSVMADEAKVARLIAPFADQLSIAAVNGPASVVISGGAEAMQRVVKNLEEEGVKARRLQVSHAFHSPLMEPILAEFKRIAGQIEYRAPSKPFVSNLTGNLAQSEVAQADYWVRHLRGAVRFADGVATAQRFGAEIFVEIGPKPTLLSMAKASLSDTALLLPSLRTGQPPHDLRQMWLSLSQLYVQGVGIKPALFAQADGPKPARIALPTYPFQRQPYWVEAAGQVVSLGTGASAVQEMEGWTPLLAQLDQGNLGQVVAQIVHSRRFSPAQIALLPGLIEALSAEHQKQRTDAELQKWLYEIVWQASPLPANQPAGQPAGDITHWLIVTGPQCNGDGGLGERVAERLIRAGYGAEVYDCAAPGPSALDDGRGSLWQQMGHAAGLGLLYLQPAESAELAPAQTALEASCGLLELVQGLVQQRKGAPTRLWVATQGQSLLDGDPAALPTPAALWGMGHVIGLEEPGLWGGLIDLPVAVEAADLDVLTGTLIGQAQQNQPAENRIAIRRGGRYVPRLTALSPARRAEIADAPPVSPSGATSYLITGGLGGLGLQAARALAAQQPSGCRLILMGRHGPNEQARQVIAELARQGAQVTLFQGDVACEADVARLFAQADPPIGGIIHAAGVLDDGILLRQNRARFEQVFAPKVLGSWLLHQYSQAHPLDFFVSFSSAAALFGSPGQSSYSAANAFMDGLVGYRRSLGLPALSIQWSAWAEVGMAAAQKELNLPGVQMLTPAQGGQILARLLGAGGHIGVLPVDWARFGRQFAGGAVPPLLADLVRASQAGQSAGLVESAENQHPESHPDRAKGLREQLALAEPAAREALVLGFVRQQVARIMRFDGDQVDMATPLLYLGMDSLMAVEIRDRIRAALGLEIELVALLEGMTISSLAQRVMQHIGNTMASPSAVHAPTAGVGTGGAGVDTEIEWTEGEL